VLLWAEALHHVALKARERLPVRGPGTVVSSKERGGLGTRETGLASVCVDEAWWVPECGVDACTKVEILAPL